MRRIGFSTLFASSIALAAPTPPMTPDVPPTFVPVKANYERRVVMIPMRDGVKLSTIILVPKGAKRAPILLTRTPYSAAKRTERNPSLVLKETLPIADDQFADGSYIRVFQDIRGKYASEGDYVMTRPLRGPLNDTKVDHSTDAYDTIDWLVKHVPETNGKVGMLGSSYEGFTVLMALVHPHPALAAAVPMCPMVDGWRGDDWFHNGAFRQINLDYFYQQTGQHGEGTNVARGALDDYETFRRAGSTGDYAKAAGFDQLPYWKKLSEHPAYDAYWSQQALDKILAAEPISVPTMIVGSQWDQEDAYGAMAMYAALEPKDTKNDRVYLVLGPWRHSGAGYDGGTLGPLKFENDTAQAFRRDTLKPFLDQRLQDHPAASTTSPVTVYETGTNAWRKIARWPIAGTAKTIFLGEHGAIATTAPKDATGYEEYISDPAKPVAYVPRPVSFLNRETAWRNWLLADQRTVVDRPDVISWVGEPLTAPLHLAGAPKIDLVASTSGTDADWIVKLIDVYPDEVPGAPELSGYELPIGMDIFRGRYRDGFDKPSAIPANTPLHYKFALPHHDHVFLPGHRIMIQVQSSWFPLYDRNPQTYVPNIFFAAPGDYKKATQRIYRSSSVELPVVP